MNLSHKDDVINNFLGAFSLVIVYLNIIVFLMLMNQDVLLTSFFTPLWVITLGVPLILVGLLVLISTFLRYLNKKIIQKDFSGFKSRFLEKRQKWSKAKKDTIRKLNHILIFIVLLSVWFIGLSIVNYYTGSSAGMIPEETNMFFLYILIINEPDSIFNVLFSLGWFYYILFFFFYNLSLFILANEFARKSRLFSFPFNIFPELYLSKEESKNYGTYLYFAIGHMFAAFICSPMVFFAILGISSLSDLMTSQVGIRFGKSHIPWNQDKTWKGTIAGTITTFIISFFFIGFFWALIFSIIFFEFDMLTSKPINISDNLLIPIGLSIIYLFIRFFFNLNHYSPILIWF